MKNDSDTPDAPLTAQLPPLRDIIAAAGLTAKKSLGQNFLLDLNLTRRIVRAAGDLSGKSVIEIGPGPGGLTRALVESTAAQIHAIERDDRCIPALLGLADVSGGRLHIIADDALKIDYESLCTAPRVLIANLPYNIATPLLISWLKQMPLFESLTLMFQKEVAERITAKHGNKTYGRLSVISQWLSVPEKQFDLPPAAFTPPPKVTSSIVHFIPRPRTDDVSFEAMERLTAAAFGQRRKMLRQSLKSLNITPEEILDPAGIAGTARAEEIDVAGFVRMAQALMLFRCPKT